MAEHEKVVRAECDACKGTGLYVGMGEHDGMAVQCSRCKGSGEVTLTFRWRDFEGRHRREGVLRVLNANPGIAVGAGNGYRLADFGGLPVEAWERGDPFVPGTEMRAFTCPAWWYQTTDYAKKPDWKECNDSLGYTFSRCPHFPAKANCWARWDAEQIAGAEQSDPKEIA